MSLLNDEAMFRLLASKEQLELLERFPGTAKMSPEYHIIVKAQHQLDSKEIIHLIEAGVADGRYLSEIIESLKQLEEG